MEDINGLIDFDQISDLDLDLELQDSVDSVNRHSAPLLGKRKYDDFDEVSDWSDTTEGSQSSKSSESGLEDGEEMKQDSEADVKHEETYEEKILRFRESFKYRTIDECLDEIIARDDCDCVPYDALLHEVAFRVAEKKNNPNYRSVEEVREFWNNVRLALKDEDEDEVVGYSEDFSVATPTRPAMNRRPKVVVSNQ